MIDAMKKALNTGVGLAMMTKEKVEELAKELAEQAKLSEHEGQQLIADLSQKADQARTDLETRVDGMVKAAVGKLNLVTREEFEAAITRLEHAMKEHKHHSSH